MPIISFILEAVGSLIATAFETATDPDGFFYRIGAAIGYTLMFLAGVVLGYVGVGVLHGVILTIKDIL